MSQRAVRLGRRILARPSPPLHDDVVATADAAFALSIAALPAILATREQRPAHHDL